MSILRVLSTVPFSNRPPVQDVIANLHSYVTFNLIIGLAILLSYKQFGGRPIECMTPMGFSTSWTDYTENYCYTADTYYVELDRAEQIILNSSEEERKERRISYYQWIPFFLIFQAACFKMPSLIWKYFHVQSGMKVGEILRLATNEVNSDPATRNENINALCGHLQRVLKFHHRLQMKRIVPHLFFRFLNMKYSSYYVTMIYLFTKCLFFLNVTGQVNLMNRYLFNSKDNLGFGFWRNLLQWNSTYWKESGIFPRVTWCDFDVREMGQSVNHTVQCVLVLNVLMEKVFLVLWAWYMILAILTLINITIWIFGFVNPASAEHFIFNHLEMSGEPLFDDKEEAKQIQTYLIRFINKYLKKDGLFILRLVAQHADVVFSTELIYRMWKSHYQIQKQREALKKTAPLWRKHQLALAKMTTLDANSLFEEAETAIDGNTYPKMGHSGSKWSSLVDEEAASVMIKMSSGMDESLNSLLAMAEFMCEPINFHFFGHYQRFII